jgi:hypothetical protein
LHPCGKDGTGAMRAKWLRRARIVDEETALAGSWLTEEFGTI